MELTQSIFGMLWGTNEEQYNELRDIHRLRLQEDIPEALVLDIWADFTPIADGLHPDYATTEQAAKRLVKAILKDRKQKEN